MKDFQDRRKYRNNYLGVPINLTLKINKDDNKIYIFIN